jgi:hypothetical protein
LTHFSACIFFLLASFDDEQRHHSWLASTPSRGSFGSLIDESPGEQYIAAFYWSAATVLTVGFGDIIPTNGAERMFATFVMFVGSIFFGYVIASMTDLLATLDMNARAVNEKMAALSSYMFKRKFPRGLQLRVKTYYRNYLEKKTGLDESVIISELSTNLQQEVVMHVIYDTIKHVPVFCDRPMHEMAKVNVMRVAVARRGKRRWRGGDDGGGGGRGGKKEGGEERGGRGGGNVCGRVERGLIRYHRVSFD